MSDQRFDAASSSVPQQTRQVRPSHASESGERSTIGKSLLIKGEISGSESLYVEGKIEGSINLPGDRVTVGKNGRVSASIAARDIVVLGEVLGNCEAADHLDIRSESSLYGDVLVSRISVEDGALLTGSIDIRRKPAPAAVEQDQVELSQAS
jgi:cytoskeletal protein CcmA (bactofilin family)